MVSKIWRKFVKLFDKFLNEFLIIELKSSVDNVFMLVYRSLYNEL